jgi:hypothetical protein
VEGLLHELIGEMAPAWEGYHLRLSQPLPPSARDMLKYFREDYEEEGAGKNELVMDEAMLMEMEQAFWHKGGVFLLHARAVFDAFNEALDLERPYG